MHQTSGTNEKENQYAIQTFDLTKKYGSRTVVNAINLSIKKGELFSLLGPNGAGKTTAIQMLSCLLKPNAGTAVIMGHDIKKASSVVKQIINASPEETAIAGHLSAWGNLRLMGGNIVCFAVGLIMGITPDLALARTLVVLFPIAVACMGIGMILGSIFTVNQAPPAGSLVIVAMGLFGGIWMPLKEVVGVFQAVGYVLPFAHAVHAARAMIINGAGLGDVTIELYWILAYTMVFFFLGIITFRWKTRH